jgi:predicted metal-dependent HD superfamily phosphohydrolase
MAAMEIAIWFHDAVYNPMCDYNEKMSADLVSKVIGISSKEIENLILDTKHDREPATHDGKTITDIDLAILGQQQEIFNEYERNIRLEYS